MRTKAISPHRLEGRGPGSALKRGAGMERGKKSRREADNSAVAGHGLMARGSTASLNLLLLYLSNEQSLLFI